MSPRDDDESVEPNGAPVDGTANGHALREELWRAAHEERGVASAFVAEPFARRRMAPSEREVELGTDFSKEEIDFSDDVAVREEPRPTRKPWVERLRDFLREYRPSRVTGGLNAFPLLLIGGVSFVEAVHASGLGILIFFMKRELGFSLAFLVSLSGIVGVIQTILAPLVGFLADRLNRTRMAFVGATGFGLASFLTGFASSPFQLGMLRAFGGIVGSANLPTHQPLLADYYPPESRGRVFAFGPLLGLMGGTIGPLIGGGIAQLWGWRTAFYILGALGTLAGGAFLFLKEPVRGRLDRLSAGADEETASIAPPPPPGIVESWRACASIVTVRRLWYAEPFLAIGGIGLFIILIAYQIQRFDLQPAQIGLFAALNTAMGFIGLLIGGPLVDRLLAYKPGRVMSGVGVLLIVDVFVFVALSFVPFLPLVLVLSLSLPLINSVLQPARTTLMSMVIPARIRAFGLQSKAPWTLIGNGFLLFGGNLISGRSLQAGLLMFVPIFLVGAILHFAAAAGVERDIRAARAATVADTATRESRATGRSKLLVCRDVDVHYDGVQILFGVDFDVEDGEIVALLGTNGAGKSTLLRAVSGLTEASNGAIFLDGRDITHVPPYEIAARRVIQMPGGRGVFPTLTVEDNLRAATWLSEEEPEALEPLIKRVTEEFFPVLRERLSQPAGTLSGGEQQMLALGQAFLMRPRLLMIDELSLGLAPAVVQQLLKILREIREAGSTIILVEQSVNLALTIADRAVFMEKGEVRFSGPTAELLQRPDILRSVFLRSGRSQLSAAQPTRREQEGSEVRSIALSARDIAISFGGIAALRGVSIEVASGEILGIIGPNGAGKTTLFDVISGFVAPDEGAVVLGARDVTSLPVDQRARLGLGRSFQDARLFPSMTVIDNILVAMERHLEVRNAPSAAFWLPKVRRSERRALRRVGAVLELLGLEDFSEKLVMELSTGTRRLVDLACMMAEDPEVLLLDEPSSGIAQAEAEELGPALERIRRDRGCSLIVIEHDMKLITSLADRLVALHLGQVLAEGSPAQVIGDPRVVDAYLGDSEEELVKTPVGNRQKGGKDGHGTETG